jgi:hypothetical protein
MSMLICSGCDKPVDSDDDPDCIVEVGNTRRLHKEIVLCEPCREKRQDEMDREAEPCTEDAIRAGCTCRMSSVHSASIDPPEPVTDKYCPLHGHAPDPDDARDRARDA